MRPKETATRYEGEDAEAVTGQILAVVFKARNSRMRDATLYLRHSAHALTRACHHATR